MKFLIQKDKCSSFFKDVIDLGKEVILVSPINNFVRFDSFPILLGSTVILECIKSNLSNLVNLIIKRIKNYLQCICIILLVSKNNQIKNNENENEKIINYLVGCVIKKSEGKCAPILCRIILLEKINEIII